MGSFEFGASVEKIILSVANLVASPGSAGIAAGIIFATLLIAIIKFFRASKNRQKAVERALRIVSRTSSRSEFAENYSAVNDELIGLVARENLKRRPCDWAIRRAWEEYAETLVLPDQPENGQIVRNTVRPSYFFNSTDLGFDHGFWRHLPGIFVSIGLFLTFLGIISAFGHLVGDNGHFVFDDSRMGLFLNTAKSKFIMSLSGLLSSIIFGVFYRVQTYRLDHSVARLADEIEYRVLYQAPEQIAAKQLAATEEQTRQLQVLGNDLGAQLGTVGVQIGEDVGQTLSNKLDPILENVGQRSGAEVGQLVGRLGDTLQSKLNESLNEMSATLGTINKTLVDVSKVLVSSGSSIGTEMTSGVEALTAVAEHLKHQIKAQGATAREQMAADRDAGQKAMADLMAAIEKNTRDNSEKLEASARELSEAAANLAGSIEQAGQQASQKAAAEVEAMGADTREKVDGAGARITESLATITGEILGELSSFQAGIDDKLAGPIRDMAVKLDASNHELQRHAQTINDATRTQSTASDRLAQSSSALEKAGQPIAESVARIDRINTTIRDALTSNVSLMESTRKSVEASMSAMKSTMDQLETVVEDVETIDESLGDAFQKISHGLVSSQEQIKTFAEEINGHFSHGIQSIQSVMDGLSEFEPVRARV